MAWINIAASRPCAFVRLSHPVIILNILGVHLWRLSMNGGTIKVVQIPMIHELFPDWWITLNWTAPCALAQCSSLHSLYAPFHFPGIFYDHKAFIAKVVIQYLHGHDYSSAVDLLKLSGLEGFWQRIRFYPGSIPITYLFIPPPIFWFILDSFVSKSLSQQL